MKKTTGELRDIHDDPNGLDPWLFHMQAMNNLLKENQHQIRTNPLISAISSSHAKLSIVSSAFLIALTNSSPNWTNKKQIYGILGARGSRDESSHLISSSPPTALDELLDLFLSCRSLLDTMDTISAINNDPKASLALLQYLVEFRDRLISWYDEWKSFIGGGPLLCEEKDYKLFNKQLLKDNPFGTFYRFVSLDNARFHILYWTAMSFAHTLVYQAQLLILSSRPTFLEAQHFSAEPADYEAFVLAGYYADQVCRAIPYCMQPIHRIWGTHVVFGTISHVFKVYVHLMRSPTKFFWCQRVLEVVGELGLEMALYFAGVAKKEWDAVEDAHENITRCLSWHASGGIQYFLDGLLDSNYDFGQFDKLEGVAVESLFQGLAMRRSFIV